MTRKPVLIFVIVCVILFSTGCSLFASKSTSKSCINNPFANDINSFPGQNELQIGYYSQESFITANVNGENKLSWANGIYPTWSPNGRFIVYREANDICFANRDGSQLRKIVEGKNLGGLSWSPDGKYVVYSDLEDNYQPEIFMVSLDGEITQLTFSPEADDQSPAWSPDSKHVAFVTYSDPIDTGGYIEYTITISILDINTKQALPITLDGLEPSWSPDGKKLLFESVDDRICVVDTDGKNNTCLTSDFTDYAPQWSPDGNQIIFTRIDKDWSIYIMNSDGSEQTWLANGIFPIWSPDGNQIAFGTGGEKPDLYVINSNGTELTLVAENVWGYTWVQP